MLKVTGISNLIKADPKKLACAQGLFFDFDKYSTNDFTQNDL